MALDLAERGARDAMPKIEAAMAAGTPSRAFFDCVWAAGAPDLIAAGGARGELGTKIDRLCSHDVPLAAIEKDVKAAEAEHAAAPKDPMPTTCVVNDVTIALKQLKNHDDAKTLLARLVAVCPDWHE
jgi:hypothetical protein